MSTAVREILRVSLAGERCRSAGELLMLNLGRIAGVDAVTLDDKGSLLVLSLPGAEVADQVVTRAVAAGFEPTAVRTLRYPAPAHGRPLTCAEAERLGVVASAKEPVRARTEAVQRVSVEVTDGYDPDTILVEAGIPVEIGFSEGHGCLSEVVFDGLGVRADLRQGGAVVRLPALDAGHYTFRCGMDMVHGVLIAE